MVSEALSVCSSDCRTVMKTCNNTVKCRGPGEQTIASDAHVKSS